mgnify:CR=1 FL=1
MTDHSPEEQDGRAERKALSPALENYLEIIFLEEAREGAARASSIADAAGVSRSTVTSTLKVLKLPFVTNAQIGDSTNAEFLQSLGIGNYDICFVTIGGSFQNSLETTSLLKELDRKSTRLNSSHVKRYRMPSSA